MKKMLAMLLALMLLTASAAMAETGIAFTLSNPTLTITQDGQPMSIDISKVALNLDMGLVEETPTMRVDVTGDAQSLLGLVMQVTGNTAIISIDGVSRPLSADVSSSAGSLPLSAEELFKALLEVSPASGSMQLPKFTGVDIPKIDLMSVGAMFGATGDAQHATFELPYEMVSMLLSQLSQYKSMIPESAQSTVGPVFDAIDEMIASNSGFALKGDITDDGAAATLVVDVLPVAEGVTADEAALRIQMYSALNQVNLTVDLLQGAESMTVGDMALTSIPDQAELNLNLSLAGGMVTLNGSLHPGEDEGQAADLELSANGQTIYLSLNYGDQVGGRYVGFAAGVEGQADFTFLVETEDDGDGNEHGLITATVTTAATNGAVEFSGEYSQTVGEVALSAIPNAADAVDANAAMSDETLGAEIQNALGGLMGYLGALTPAA